MLRVSALMLVAMLLACGGEGDSQEDAFDLCAPDVYSFCDATGGIVHCDGEREVYRSCEGEQRCVGGLMRTGSSGETYRFALCAWPGEPCIEGQTRCETVAFVQHCRDDFWSYREPCYDGEHCTDDAGACVPFAE